MKYSLGFTLVEIIVVIALVALLSSVVLFDGAGSRDRHTVQSAYSALEISLSQASLLSRAQNNDDDLQSSTHWVFDSSESNISIYQDSEAGLGGVFDSVDQLRETYDISTEVFVEDCASSGAGCSALIDNWVISFYPGESEKVLRSGGVEVDSLYVRLSIKDAVIDGEINQLGVLLR